MSQKTKGLLWLGLGIVFAATLALGLGFFARMMPWSVEKAMGQSANEITDWLLNKAVV